MTALKKISVLTLLSLISNPTWSTTVEFCKVIRTFDDKNLGAPPNIRHEDCSGVAFLDYAKDLVKASCWPGAIDLFEGRCERNNDNGSPKTKDADEILGN